MKGVVYLIEHVCLFVWGFASHSRIFHSYGDITIASVGLQISTYAQNYWPLSSKGSLAFQTTETRGICL